MGTPFALCDCIRDGISRENTARAIQQRAALHAKYLLLLRKVSVGKIAQDFAYLVNVTHATEGTSHLIVLFSTQLKNALIF